MHINQSYIHHSITIPYLFTEAYILQTRFKIKIKIKKRNQAYSTLGNRYLPTYLSSCDKLSTFLSTVLLINFDHKYGIKIKQFVAAEINLVIDDPDDLPPFHHHQASFPHPPPPPYSHRHFYSRFHSNTLSPVATLSTYLPSLGLNLSICLGFPVMKRQNMYICSVSLKYNVLATAAAAAAAALQELNYKHGQ